MADIASIVGLPIVTLNYGEVGIIEVVLLFISDSGSLRAEAGTEAVITSLI